MTGKNFKGWQVLWASFFNAMLVAGAAIYSLSLFVTPLEKEFGLSREQVNGVIFTSLYFSIALWAVLVGRYFEKLSARTLSFAGAIAFAVGYALISLSASPTIVALAVFIPLGFGLTAAGPFLANAMATRWFSTRRGRALGIATVASSAGGFFVVPVFAMLMERFGWRTAALIMGAAVAALIIGVTWRFLISRPEDVGQHPDGAATAVSEETETQSENINPFKQPTFWLIALGAGLLLGSDQALLASFIPYGQERGFGLANASLLMTAITGSAIAGKLITGWLSERYDKRKLFAAVCSANVIFLLALLTSPPYWQLAIVCSIVGLAIGGVYPVWTTLTAEAFGQQNFAKVIGAMNLITVPMIIISIQIAGRTHDQTGDYNLAFKIFIAQAVLAALIIWCVGRKNSLLPIEQ